jgi:hypothetical protein
MSLTHHPQALYDVKPVFKADDYYGKPWSTVLTRYSSPYRIAATSLGGTWFGATYLIGWAIYHNEPKRKYLLRGTAGAFALSLSYATLTEMFNGVVMRNLGKEQYFFSNAPATGLMIGVYYYFQKIIQKTHYFDAMSRSLKYVGCISCLSMFLDLHVIKRRSWYLNRKLWELDMSLDDPNLKQADELTLDAHSALVHHIEESMRENDQLRQRLVHIQKEKKAAEIKTSDKKYELKE